MCNSERMYLEYSNIKRVIVGIKGVFRAAAFFLVFKCAALIADDLAVFVVFQDLGFGFLGQTVTAAKDAAIKHAKRQRRRHGQAAQAA